MRFLTILAVILTAMETATVAAVTSAVVKTVLQTEKYCKHKQHSAAQGFVLFCFSCRNTPHGSEMFQTGRNQPPASSCQQGLGTLLFYHGYC